VVHDAQGRTSESAHFGAHQLQVHSNSSNALGTTSALRRDLLGERNTASDSTNRTAHDGEPTSANFETFPDETTNRLGMGVRTTRESWGTAATTMKPDMQA
jgi:hypothetical protein